MLEDLGEKVGNMCEHMGCFYRGIVQAESMKMLIEKSGTVLLSGWA